MQDIIDQWKRCETFTTLMLERRGWKPLHPHPYEAIQTDNVAIFSNSIENQQILVWYFRNEKLNIEALKELLHYLELTRIHHCIVIYGHTVTASAKKVIENLFQFEMEMFGLYELLYDITQFKYYCKHTKVTDERLVNEIKTKFGNHLPILLRNDIVARYFHFQKGDIIQIQRKNHTLCYRVVK